MVTQQVLTVTQVGMVKQAFCFICNIWTFYIENAFTYHCCNEKIKKILNSLQKKKKKEEKNSEKKYPLGQILEQTAWIWILILPLGNSVTSGKIF